MSHYRNLGGGKRDANEPQIMKRFAAHGWHCEQISGNRLWDLNAYPPQYRTMGVLTYHVDVKMPDGKVTPAQAEKWTALHHKGIPVYVVRTEADVDALMSGELRPWVPETSGRAVLATATAHAGKRLRVVRESGKGEKLAPRPDNRKGREFYGQIGKPPFPVHAESSGYDPSNPPVPSAHRTNPMATKAVVPSEEDAAVARAVLAAQEADATFAPGPTCNCGHSDCCLEHIGARP